jgi:hypothetical protein
VDMTFISVTRLRIRLLRFMPKFIYYSLMSANQTKKSGGNLGMKLLRDANRVFWTCTAWQDEASMRAFMTAKPHLRAMAKLPNWCDEAAVAHWTQESANMPDWMEAHRRIATEGRRSKVNHPSPAHVAFQINVPKL